VQTVHVNLKDRSYDVFVAKGLISQTGELIKSIHLNGKVAIISDSNVVAHHSISLIQSLEKVGIPYSIHVVTAGEASKSLVIADQLCSELAAENHDRSSFIIALGGGVVGDLAGFVASIFYRGIPFVQIPTTIVSLVDSSVGGKTSVNIAEGKNLVGAFHQPKIVIADPEMLKSLKDREYFAGFAEVIKHAAIRDPKMLNDIAKLDPQTRIVPSELIARNIAIKARIVEEDEHETLGVRALLNFGHTIGHGIEASLPYGEILHGEAISFGIRAALFLSEKYFSLPQSDSDKIINLLRKFNLPLQLSPSIKKEMILEKLSRDKKFSSGQIRFVLINKAGSGHVSSSITQENLIQAIEHLRTPI
jgi:3-dehydroquinate synthase